MSGEAEVPSIDLPADVLGSAATRVRSRAGMVGPDAEQTVNEWLNLSSIYNAPETAELVDRMNLLSGGGAQAGEAFARAGEIVGELADALTLLGKRRSAVVTDASEVSITTSFERTDMGHAIARLRSDIDAALEDACRKLAALASPPPMAVAATGIGGPLIGPRVTWQRRAQDFASAALLAPLVEVARGGPDRVRRIVAGHPEWAERLRQRRLDPAAVRAWWDALPADTQTALVNGAPAIIGSLGGVPPLARVGANRVAACERLPAVKREISRNEALAKEGAMATLQADRRRTLDGLYAERDYLESVVEGDVQLVLYEPDENRIAEMIGTPGPGTRRVLTYVPGTFTSTDSFYRRQAQALPRWLVDQDSNMVAFVWKGTDFPGDDEGRSTAEQLSGILEANQQSRALPAGQALASFSADMRSEPTLAQARQIGGGYSWGLVPLSSSELAGTHFDDVHSFAGAWVPEGWAGDPATSYFHWSYTDFLSMAQDVGLVGGGRNPDTTPGFRSRIYDRPGDWDVPLGGGLALFLDPDGPSIRISFDPFGNHDLIASARRENHQAAFAISESMKKERR